ncbi:MAG: class I SAM-dependent methyltransferase, partial [Desulfocucumaceae bacterium]
MLAVTTSLRDGGKQLEKALIIGTALNVPYLPRENHSIEELLLIHNLQGLLVLGKESLAYKYQGGEFFFHPGMAKLRIKEINNGKTDQMIKALDLRPGDSVLDCTLGLGSDAIVMAFRNQGGEVTGLEHSPVVSLIVKEGLSTYSDGDTDLEKAMRSIKVLCADYNNYLKNQPESSVDIIYFDPMFRTPGKKSCSLEAMRPLTDNTPISPHSIEEALRVARRRVVVKESCYSKEFARLGI